MAFSMGVDIFELPYVRDCPRVARGNAGVRVISLVRGHTYNPRAGQTFLKLFTEVPDGASAARDAKRERRSRLAISKITGDRAERVVETGANCP